MIFEYDYEPNLENVDGENIDTVIEDLLAVVYDELWNTPNLDRVFTAVLREHINDDCPDLMVSYAGRDRVNTSAINYLVMLQLDFTVITQRSPQWPSNGFSFLPSATTAVAVHYPHTDEQSDYAPGISINQAALAALLQMARELSIVQHNQPELPLRPYDA